MFRCLLAAGLALAASGPAFAAKQNQTIDRPSQAAPLRADTALRCEGPAAKPAQLVLQLGKSNLMRLPEPVQHRSVGNPLVVQALQVAPDTLYIAGIDIGSTNMIVQGRSGQCSMLDITVSMDVAPLQATLSAALPDERDIKVMAAGDTLVLSGTVSDTAAAARAIELTSAYVRRPLRPLPTPDKDTAVGQNGAEGGTGPGARVVNLLSVSAPQQVQLEVKVAEVSKSLLERLKAGTT